MPKSILSVAERWLGSQNANPRAGRQPNRRPCRFELLEDRTLLAVTADFSATTGVLNVRGDSLDNTIEVSRTAGGSILVNGGAVAIAGGAPTVANTALVQLFGLSGNDTLSVNEANGALPAAKLYGGSGDDTLIGGSGNDQLFGQSGSDLILGHGGGDLAFGGADDDALTGGDGDDLIFGQSGSDGMTWNPGDDTDLNEGGASIDTVEVNGGGGAEVFTTTANGTRVRFDRLDPAPFALDIGTTELLVLHANGGADSFSATGNLAALIQITVDGGAGDDVLNGSNGADTLIGGDDNDMIDGNQGADIILMGAGDDLFNWDPGDGNDVIEGQDGADRVTFNGSNGSEIFDVSANGERVRFTRNLGNIVLDIKGVERLDTNALGAADSFVVNDLSGTDLRQVFVNMAALGGGGDAQADSIIVNATNVDDAVLVGGDSSLATVLGLYAVVNIVSPEAAFDRLIVNLLDGDDVLDASGLSATSVGLTGDGGAGNDVLTGGDGADTLIGGLDDDVLIGGPGFDVLDGGLGDNVVIQ